MESTDQLRISTQKLGQVTDHERGQVKVYVTMTMTKLKMMINLDEDCDIGDGSNLDDFLMIFNRNFEPRLSRKCNDEVSQLRGNWDKLLATAEKVYLELVREKRGIYEQELDKQVKVKAFWKQFLSYLVSNDFDSGHLCLLSPSFHLLTIATASPALNIQSTIVTFSSRK